MLMILALAAAAAAAPSGGTPAAPTLVTMPDWASKPNGEDLAEFYPKAAAASGTPGSATISCKIDVEGALMDCAVLTETPSDQGFGAAALKMAAKFKMRPMTRDGKPVAGGTVRIPINFALPKPPSLEQALTCYGALANAAERQPSEATWRPAAGWAGVLAYNLSKEGKRPSDWEAALGAARKTAASRPPAQDAEVRSDCVNRGTARPQGG
jgi:TonB family protein